MRVGVGVGDCQLVLSSDVLVKHVPAQAEQNPLRLDIIKHPTCFELMIRSILYYYILFDNIRGHTYTAIWLAGQVVLVRPSSW